MVLLGESIRKLLTTTDHEILNLDKFGYASDHLSIDQTINQLKKINTTI